jgi:hypothetical protein
VELASAAESRAGPFTGEKPSNNRVVCLQVMIERTFGTAFKRRSKMEDKKKVSKVSQRKLEANRSNAMRSTGPTTEAGKARAAQNSYKHGIFAKRLFSRPEQLLTDGPDYDSMLRDVREHFSPVGGYECFWVERIATEGLRLARVLGFEQKIFSFAAPFESRSIDKLMRYETSTNRRFDYAVEQLERLQEMRKAESQAAESEETNSEDFIADSPKTEGEQLPLPTNSLADFSAEFPSFDASEPNLPIAETTDELHVDSTIENCETNPPNSGDEIESTYEELQTDNSDYGDREDSRIVKRTIEAFIDNQDDTHHEDREL